MEAVVILLFIILVILILSFRNSTLSRIGDLEDEIRKLRQEIKRITAAETEKTVSPWRPVSDPAPASRSSLANPSAVAAPSPEKVQTDKLEPQLAAAAPSPENVQPGNREPHPFASLPPVEKPGFFERHPDLEKFIGENLVSKIGIAILVLAIAYFVKYAIDNDWIGPVGRVGTGILCGGILIGIAHLLRSSYKAFSSVLVGGGLAVLYFTIALAFHQYRLLPQSVAFVIMLVITTFAVILSMLYDRQELAIIALAGGFVAPFLVSDGAGNYKVLFSYLLILNTGLLAISLRKSWRLLNIFAFVLTSILFISWLATLPYDEKTATYRGAWIFATIFYLLFFIINITHNIRRNKSFIASDFSILLANTCLYAGAGLYLMAAMGLSRYQGLFSASMAIFNLCACYFLFRRKKVDANILYLLIGITLTFVSLTAPIQLHGHYITLFWASEAVLLYWLSQRSGLRIIAAASFLVWAAMLVSLFMDWAIVYEDNGKPLPVFFNKGLMTTLYSTACCYALFLLRKRSVVTDHARGIDRIASHVIIITGNLLLFAGGAFEINHQFGFYFPHTELDKLYLAFYAFCWSSFVLYAGRFWRWWGHDGYTSGLLALSIVTYLALIPQTYRIQTDLLVSGQAMHFLAHWSAVLLVAYMIGRSVSWWKAGSIQPAVPAAAFTWMICTVIVLFLSAEMLLLANHLFYDRSRSFDHIGGMYSKIALPVIWGLCSFAYMWLGMRFKFKPLRIVSLVLFSITLVKLFLFDIRNIPIAGKISAFFCLGVLLLVVSFMYQRLKKIIIEDDKQNSV